MQILNLTNVKKSDINWNISFFPDGEIQITLGEFSHKDNVLVKCRITNANDLFILMQVADILNRHGITWNLEIYYLMSMRMDRVMDFNRPYNLKIVCNIIKNLGCKSIYILEPHSRACYDNLDCFDVETPLEYLKLNPDYYDVYNNYLVIFPDKGAYERYNGQWRESSVVTAEKVRDPKTGKIESIKITNPEVFENNIKPIMVVDDLCDAGGTFVGIAKEIRKYTDKELNIFVTHMVNIRGIENLSKNYDHVYFTNSYNDWKNDVRMENSFPENITQIDII